ncbi:MAG: hypothetical protein WD509_01050 [Candidatus Paceibacterota bacterium]
MPKPAEYPDLFDYAIKLDVWKLKKWGYLEMNSCLSGTVTWTRGYNKSRIGIEVKISNSECYVILDYLSNGEPIKYKVNLVTIPSNLGKGEIYYFECPKTFKRCRYLYSIGKYFYHREAFLNSCYHVQTFSKNDRDKCKIIDATFKEDKAYQELYSPYFKKYYNGIPTKRYLRVKRNIAKGSQYSSQEITKAMI